MLITQAHPQYSNGICEVEDASARTHVAMKPKLVLRIFQHRYLPMHNAVLSQTNVDIFRLCGVSQPRTLLSLR